MAIAYRHDRLNIVVKGIEPFGATVCFVARLSPMAESLSGALVGFVPLASGLAADCWRSHAESQVQGLVGGGTCRRPQGAADFVRRGGAQ